MTNFLCPAILLVSCTTNISHTPGVSLLHGREDTLKVKRTTDFEINGDGSKANWNNSDWLELPKSGGSVSYQTKVKITLCLLTLVAED